MANMDFEAEIKKLQDTLVVVTEIQRRQAEVQRIQAEETDAVRERQSASEARFERIETSLAEAGEKINALVAILDGLIKRDRPES